MNGMEWNGMEQLAGQKNSIIKEGDLPKYCNLSDGGLNLSGPVEIFRGLRVDREQMPATHQDTV